MEKSLLIKFIGESPSFKIVDFLIENKGLDVTKKEIIEGADISRASLFKCWKQLEENGLVTVKRQFGKTKLYSINSKNTIVKNILQLESSLIERAIENNSLVEIPN
jgi:DNA-binding PadR family transcriptional regulator